MNRKDTLKRINGLTPQIGKHLAKIADDPDGRDVPHWIKEVQSWIAQIEHVLPDVGDRTSKEWQQRIAGWKAQLEA
jgi:hypothetical protein